MQHIQTQVSFTRVRIANWHLTVGYLWLIKRNPGFLIHTVGINTQRKAFAKQTVLLFSQSTWACIRATHQTNPGNWWDPCGGWKPWSCLYTNRQSKDSLTKGGNISGSIDMKLTVSKEVNCYTFDWTHTRFDKKMALYKAKTVIATTNLLTTTVHILS